MQKSPMQFESHSSAIFQTAVHILFIFNEYDKRVSYMLSMNQQTCCDEKWLKTINSWQSRILS